MHMLNGSYGDIDGLDGGADAGVILGGALNGVTTVAAFNMQEETALRYEKVRTLPPTKKSGISYEQPIPAECEHWCYTRKARDAIQYNPTIPQEVLQTFLAAGACGGFASGIWG